MISTKKNRIPILQQCKFLVDAKQDKKLDAYELTRFYQCYSANFNLYYIYDSNLKKQRIENIFNFNQDSEVQA